MIYLYEDNDGYGVMHDGKIFYNGLDFQKAKKLYDELQLFLIIVGKENDMLSLFIAFGFLPFLYIIMVFIYIVLEQNDINKKG